ncbi:MAG: hypothetical protein WA211_05365 [Candidatus Acidiferrales bacterium]
MRFEVEFNRRFLGGSLLGILLIGSPFSYVHETVVGQSVAKVPLTSDAAKQNGTSGLFSRMTVRHQWQEAHLARLSVTRTYMVQNEKGKIVAEQVVFMEYAAPGTETFTSSSEKGSTSCLVKQPQPWKYEQPNMELSLALPPHAVAAITIEFA